MKTTLFIALILCSIGLQAQTKDSTAINPWTNFKGKTLTTSTGCEACNLDFNTGTILLSKPHTELQYDNTVKMRISSPDTNDQQTGWFDKRYVKITSDSTFVILPKTK